MKFHSRMFYGIISIVLSLVIAFIVVPTVTSSTNGKETIIRVKKDIAKGAKIKETDIEVVEVGSYNLPSNIAKTTEDVVDKYAMADLFTKDHILATKISFNPISTDINLNNIPSGKVAMSITVRTLASGLSDKLQPGDIIRLYHYLDRTYEYEELQSVQVLSVTDDKGLNIDQTKELLEEEEKQQSATITILLDPYQAKLVTTLENEGVIHVALITRGNEIAAKKLLQEQDEIINNLIKIDNGVEEGYDQSKENPKEEKTDMINNNINDEKTTKIED